MSLTPASESISNTEICYYEQFRDGIILRKGNDYHVYHDKSYSDSKNWFTFGKFFLPRPIVAQVTKLNS